MRSKLLLTVTFGFLFLALLICNVSAHKWACLTYGDTIPHYTCNFAHCKLCLNDKGYSTDFGYCDKSKQCVFGIVNNDTTPPVLTLFSPTNNFIYKERRVLFNLTTDEPATISYTDNINGRGKWSKISSNMLKYFNYLSFKDGLANITIRAEDRHGNYVDVQRVFYVDTKKPKVNSPKTDDNGSLIIGFEEENPVSLSLKLGNNSTGYVSYDIDINKECNKTKDSRYSCLVKIPEDVDRNLVAPYNGQIIESWLELRDIAENIGISKKVKSLIDIDDPIINNPDSMFKVNGKYIDFKINISEKNLKGVYYFENPEARMVWKTICISLKNGICEKKVYFRAGHHDIYIIVLDDAGNKIIKGISFDIA